MNESYLKGHSQYFKSINGKIIDSDNTFIQCQQNNNGDTLCILNSPANDKSLIETLETDFPLAKSCGKSRKKSGKKTAKPPPKKTKKKLGKKSTKKSRKKK